ncbi:WD40-repeat-containing domain protein [Pseudomassariella vexata]|uniref:WD40-repeat-containing domain protein n=1 Tax=Pseudomassariella vexata TaxID=1141098 RepID=A0A1Y2DPZ8_9PEZI|nr:WD40-repeat-containing domain protein [Pseudomassariella vexata]ORY61358.1 WD40-repeat-containing domain protein [Pseudomassariella vexata]
MKAEKLGDVSVYTVAGAETARPLPEWLARRRKRSLKTNSEYQNRVELLQDFEFEEASQCIRVSEDGDWIMSTGTYKPQMHVHYTPHLSLSFARHTTSLNTTFRLLSSDYTKSLHLQSDRSLEFHTKGGCHYATRIPRYGRDLVYDRHSTEALIPSVGLDAEGSGEVFRMNLELGRFMKSYQIDVGRDDSVETGLQGGINVGSVNTGAIAEDSHNLLAFGTSVGTVEFWDPRSKSRVAIIGGQEEITALDFNPTGLSIATGTSTGLVKIFDLRSPVPLFHKDQGNGFPIKELIHLTTASQEKKILSADKKTIKIWAEDDGKHWTSVEPLVDINSVAWCKGSGMILTANEGRAQHSFLIPQLGPAPRWCSFLDNMVEEMAEEVQTTTYDNYKFCTLPDLKSLGLDHLIGKSNLLRPYMHGYFVASKFYDQAKLIANPYAWEEERAKRVKEKVDKERASRIRGNKKVKINQKLVDKLLKRQENRAQVDTNAGLLGDDRFGKLFEDEEFVVDENSREFQVLNPSTKIDPNSGATNKPAVESPAEEDTDMDGSDESEDEIVPQRKLKDVVEMRVSSSNAGSGRHFKDTTLGSRAQIAVRSSKTRPGEVVGEQSMSFVPERKKKQNNQDVPEQQTTKDRRKSDARRSASGNTFRQM